MKVGGEDDACRIDASSFLALGFAVELLPPLAQILQAGFEAHQDLYLLAPLGIEQVADSSILDGCIVFCFGKQGLTLIGSTLKHGADVESSQHYGQKTDRSEYAETAAHVVGNHESAVAFLGGESFERALPGVGDGDDTI